jgi:hypothetical protein
MIDTTVMMYLDAIYSANESYKNEAHDAMGTCGYPVGKT